MPLFPILGRLDCFWIRQMRQIPNLTNCVYSFWVGMPLWTQNHILELCAGCPTVDTLAVFKDQKWRTPDEGEGLPRLPPRLAPSACRLDSHLAPAAATGFDVAVRRQWWRRSRNTGAVARTSGRWWGACTPPCSARARSTRHGSLAVPRD
jgi:hypothetical protein